MARGLRVHPAQGPDQAPRPLEDADAEYRAATHAVIIGIDQYADAQIRPLRFACADAQAIRDVLIDPDVGRFNPANVTVLLNERATQRAIRSAIGTALRARTSPDDTVLLYFAGHGAPEIDARGQQQDGIEKYLVPYDADLHDLFASAISMEEVARLMGRIAARQVILFLDCCYSGTAGGRTFSRPDLQSRALLSREFLEHLGSEGRCVITACDVNEVALEAPELGHGIFTHYLVKGLRGEADPNDSGVVSVDALYDYVFSAVTAEARRRNGSMSPVRKGEVRGRVVLTQYESPRQRRVKALHADAEKAHAEGRADDAERLWQEVIELDPDHQAARERLDAIAADRMRVQQETQARLLKIRDLYNSGALSEEHFARAVEVAEVSEKSLTGTNAQLRRLVDGLVAGRLTTTAFSRSVELITGTPRASDAGQSVTGPATHGGPIPPRLRIGLWIGAGLLTTAVAIAATAARVRSADMSADLQVDQLSFELASAAALAQRGELLRARRLDIAGLRELDSALITPGRDPTAGRTGLRLVPISVGGRTGALAIDLTRELPTGTRLTIRRTAAARTYMLSFERSRHPGALLLDGPIELTTSTGPRDVFRFAAPTPAAVSADSIEPLDFVAELPSEDTVVLARAVRAARLAVRRPPPRFVEQGASANRSAIVAGRVQVDPPDGPVYSLERENVLNWKPTGPLVIDRVVMDGGDIRIRFRARVESLELASDNGTRNAMPRIADRIGGERVVVALAALVTGFAAFAWLAERGRRRMP